MDVLINPGLVVQEVLIDGEGALHRSVGAEVMHDFVFVAGEAVHLSGPVPVLIVHVIVSFLAAPLAPGGGALLASAGGARSGDVVLARLDLVGAAALSAVEAAPRHDAYVVPVLEGFPRPTPVASCPAAMAA